MIDLELSAENRLVRDTARAFAEAEILPHIREWDERHEVHLPTFQKMGDQGFLGHRSPSGMAAAGWTTSASGCCAKSWSGRTPPSGWS